MTPERRLKRRLVDLKRALKRTVAQIGAAAEGATSAGGRNVSVAGRVNRAVAANVGRQGATQHAESHQTLRIVQDGRTVRDDAGTLGGT